jgi:uncharacterized protein (TIGR02145 family)
MATIGAVAAAGCSSNERAFKSDGAAGALVGGAAGGVAGGASGAGTGGAYPVAGAAAGVAGGASGASTGGAYPVAGAAGGVAGGASGASTGGAYPVAGAAGAATGAGPGCGPTGGGISGGAGGQAAVAGTAGISGEAGTAAYAGTGGVIPNAGAGGQAAVAGAAGMSGEAATAGHAGTGGVIPNAGAGGQAAVAGAAGMSGEGGTAGSPSGWTCGEPLIDARDDKVYATVALGGLCWMATNLDVGQRIETTEPQNDPGQIQKYCLNNDPAMCDAYGGLYQWAHAMQYTEVEGAPGICPAGWSIATDQEWKDLEIALGMDPAVADQDNWRGAPVGTALKVGGSSGFNAPLSGMSANGQSYNYPTYGYYWTSTLSTQYPWRRCLTSGPTYPPDTVGRWDTWPGSYALPIRCVRSK